MKSKKNIIIFSAIILILVGFIYFKFSGKNEIVGKYIINDEYSKSISETFKDEVKNTSSEEKQKEDKKNYISIVSKIGFLCTTFDTIEKAINSQIFPVVKGKILHEGEKLYGKDQFLYVNLPTIVIDECSNVDNTYSEKLLRLLQMESNKVFTSTKNDINEISKLAKNVVFNKESLDKTKLQKDDNYFQKVFFQNNLKQIMDTYYFEHTYYSKDVEKFFFTQTLFSLSDTNNIYEKALGNLQDFVKEAGFKDLAAFQQRLLKFVGYKTVDTFKEGLKSDYKKLADLTKEKLKISLYDKTLNINTLRDFYSSDDFKKMKADSEIYAKFKKLGRDYLIFSMVSSDYSDSISEGWSGKMFFGDTLIGNGIIRLGYVYMLDQATTK